MTQTGEKRQVPSLLRRFLAVDAYLTQVFVNTVEKSHPLRQLKIHYRLLEYSCHGIPWLAGWLAFIWILNNKDLYQMQVNLMIGLLLDITIVALLKAIVRRRRPAINDDPLSMGPDKYSFPSGHASRAALIAFFFINSYSVSIILTLPLLAWCTAISVSRLLMRRHYIFDVISGLILGIVQGLFINYIYLDPETCANLIFWLTDEKLDGGEYHV